ncbi:MAG: electron transporter RnfD [Candidatus Cloacimonadota bacterium]|nr:MAG: electron transporter RnfD [Candidatus Cloacimonadota bacterium]
MNNKFVVSAAPHMHEPISVKSVMWQVVIALLPAQAVACVFFGMNSLFLTLYAVIAAVCTEALIQKLRKKEITVKDGSAVVTGMLVAFNIHAASPWWLPAVGAVFAIGIGKQVFGGLGHNPFNPALLARAFMVASWPSLTTAGWVPALKKSINGISQNIDNLPEIVTSATPLAVAKALRNPDVIAPELREMVAGKLFAWDTVSNLFWGNTGGVTGEVSAAALLLGAAFLSLRHIIEWRIPVSYIGTAALLAWLFGGVNGFMSASLAVPVFHIFAGGLILGAFFMATDMVTSPVTKRGRIYFGIGCGIITMVIRLVGGYPEGVSYSILLMNMAVPLIDRFTVPKFFGERKK